MERWKVLVVDDEEDVHAVTRLALKRKVWRGRAFELTHVYSRAEAENILREANIEFDVAIVDVVMEENDSGLRLCDHIRKTQSPHMRIILRTGQPDLAPEEAILDNYDIDYYIAKSEASASKLFAVIRSCLRSGQDMQTLSAFSTQIQKFTTSMQEVTILKDLLLFMDEGLGFLRLKHQASLLFFYVDKDSGEVTHSGADLADTALLAKLEGLYQREQRPWLRYGRFIPGSELQLDEQVFLLPFEARNDQNEPISSGGLLATMDSPDERHLARLETDARMFLENWKVAFAALTLRQHLAQEAQLRQQMYQERLESIANMVAGVAHEMNTPLGVANTANAMIMPLVAQLDGASEADRSDIVEDLEESILLLGKNLLRAQRLVGSFKQLSSSQLSDQRSESSFFEIIQDCVETMGPELRKQKISIEIKCEASLKEKYWDGYPGSLSQVIINLIQNAIRYAYEPGVGGAVEIRITGNDSSFAVEFQDFGKGVDPAVLGKIFEPFVTTGRATGGTGLGLAISYNIVTELLGGNLVCESNLGTGTTFELAMPLSAPQRKILEAN